MKDHASKEIAGYTVFDTEIGRCGIAWNGDNRIVRVGLPERTQKVLREKLAAPLCRNEQVNQSATPPEIADVIERVQKHLQGESQDFADVDIDIEWCPQFHQKVYRALRAVPAGQTISYQGLAAEAGSAKGSRAVGQAMARNPLPIIVPCQRVFKASGELGGFSAYGGEKTKIVLLQIEKSESVKHSCLG